MIVGILHQGSGLGNQLFRYVTTRAIAKKKSCDFGMIFPENFKGQSFMQLDMGTPVGDDIEQFAIFREKKVMENGVDIRGYDPEINFITDNTIIDGEFQDERYWNLPDINEWLKVDPLTVPDDLCIIGFRGGEYKIFPDLFLSKAYWDAAMSEMRFINPKMKFRVVTDDPPEALKMFGPDMEITHDIGMDWRQIRYAKYAIIANSSFYILPRLLAHGMTIAPRYWGRHNTETWALPSNYYDQFTYL